MFNHLTRIKLSKNSIFSIKQLKIEVIIKPVQVFPLNQNFVINSLNHLNRGISIKTSKSKINLAGFVTVRSKRRILEKISRNEKQCESRVRNVDGRFLNITNSKVGGGDIFDEDSVTLVHIVLGGQSDFVAVAFPLAAGGDRSGGRGLLDDALAQLWYLVMLEVEVVDVDVDEAAW